MLEKLHSPDIIIQIIEKKLKSDCRNKLTIREFSARNQKPNL